MRALPILLKGLTMRRPCHPDLRQTILAVLLDGDGRPVCSEMWPGNTADVTTLIPVIDRLRRRFDIDDPALPHGLAPLVCGTTNTVALVIVYANVLHRRGSF